MRIVYLQRVPTQSLYIANEKVDEKVGMHKFTMKRQSRQHHGVASAR